LDGKDQGNVEVGMSRRYALSFHKGSGQWCKKVQGKTYYFGKDLDKALARWVDERESIIAGKPRASANDDTRPTIAELANLFISKQREEASRGERSREYVEKCEDSIRRMIAIVGADTRPDDLSPIDFDALRESLYSPTPRKKTESGAVCGRTVSTRAATTVVAEVQRIRRFFSWCHARELISPPRYGDGFRPVVKHIATKAAVTKHRDLTAKQVRRLIDTSRPLFKPLLLLGINAGIGNRDIAEIRMCDIDLSQPEVWVDLPRIKTGNPRRFVLWDETAQAIRQYLTKRPKPLPEYDDVLFLTRSGWPWVRGGLSTVSTTFSVLRDECDIPDRSFYDLRRTFQTIAADSLDFPAVQHIMGHAPGSNDMSARYTQRISDARIRAVCHFVRDWLGTATCD
jgi:integrase